MMMRINCHVNSKEEWQWLQWLGPLATFTFMEIPYKWKTFWYEFPRFCSSFHKIWFWLVDSGQAFTFTSKKNDSRSNLEFDLHYFAKNYKGKYLLAWILDDMVETFTSKFRGSNCTHLGVMPIKNVQVLTVIYGIPYHSS